MKYLLTLFALVTSLTLSAGLNPEKLGEAILNARLGGTADRFFYAKVEDEKYAAAFASINKNAKQDTQKVYGPYNLILKDIPPNTRFKLYSFTVSNTSKPILQGSGYIDEQGIAWLKQKDGDSLLINTLFTAGGMSPGEPLFSLVVLNDKPKTFLVACTIPNPAEATGKENRHVAAELLTRNGIYLTKGHHFLPNEEVTLTVHSKNGITQRTLKVSEEGQFVCLLDKEISAHKALPDSLLITTKEQSEPLILRLSMQ